MVTPGIIMPDVFNVGDVYRQEFLLGDAEDIAENLSTSETVSVPLSGPVVASCSGTCLKTHEYSPLEPDVSESKFYAENVGVILTLDDKQPQLPRGAGFVHTRFLSDTRERHPIRRPDGGARDAPRSVSRAQSSHTPTIARVVPGIQSGTRPIASPRERASFLATRESGKAWG